MRAKHEPYPVQNAPDGSPLYWSSSESDSASILGIGSSSSSSPSSSIRTSTVVGSAAVDEASGGRTGGWMEDEELAAARGSTRFS